MNNLFCSIRPKQEFCLTCLTQYYEFPCNSLFKKKELQTLTTSSISPLSVTVKESGFPLISYLFGALSF